MSKTTFAQRFLFSLVATSLPFLIGQESATADEPCFVDLFDGETLAGWEGEESMFRVEEGAIVAGRLQGRIPHNYFLCTTEEYGDYELHFEAKMSHVGPNGGVQIRSRRQPNHHGVIGYQVDVGGPEDDYKWGSIYDESRRRRVLARGDQEELVQVVRLDDWNAYIVRCEGPRIQVWVNGYQTVDYTEEEEGIARSGIIGLQIHGGQPAEASYRNLRIAPLDPASSTEEQ